MFVCILYYLGAFGTVCLPYKTRCKMDRTGEKLRTMKSHRNFSQQTQPIHTIGPETHVLVRFVLFGCIWDRLVALKKLEAKWAKLVQKFVSRRHFGIFRNECNRSTPLEPKLMFWHFSYYFDAFGTVWLAHKTRWKTGRTNAKVCATKSRQNFSQRTQPIHHIGP